MITLSHYLFLSMILFALGVTGLMVRRNAIILLMSVELMLNAANLAVVAFARFRPAPASADNGMVLVFMVMAVAAAEVAIGLAILLNLYRQRRTVNADELNVLKG
ncbi:MAG TPA: NADH-quinone oxidoreductase subunit NuoK [bacterium]|nr:NADH-quinone oxidoreductase subunit NuoK [bacterium]HQL61363.1 NADH-quinone oxidoreductase subunit NuoK [bacterium]